MSKFLPGPRWRERTGSGRLATAITVTFIIFALLGLAVISAIAAITRSFGVPLEIIWVVWIVLALGYLPWALRSPGPATVSDYEAQSWSDFVIRYVMVGLEEPRPLPTRLLAILLFGPPLLGWGVIYLALSAIGVA